MFANIAATTIQLTVLVLGNDMIIAGRSKSADQHEPEVRSVGTREYRCQILSVQCFRSPSWCHVFTQSEIDHCQVCCKEDVRQVQNVLNFNVPLKVVEPAESIDDDQYRRKARVDCSHDEKYREDSAVPFDPESNRKHPGENRMDGDREGHYKNRHDLDRPVQPFLLLDCV